MEKIRIECTEEQLDLIIKAINKVYSERDLKKYFGYKGPIELNATHKYKTENENILNGILECFDRIELLKPGRCRLCEYYYHLRSDGEPQCFMETRCDLDDKVYESGNYFKTEAGANECIGKIKEILRGLYERSKETEVIRWRAEKRERYYTVGFDGTIFDCPEAFMSGDDKHYERGNYFKTKEEAAIIADKIKDVMIKVSRSL